MNKYQEALNRMEEAYYGSDNSMGAMSRFKEDVNLIYGLVNEHFEEKQEKNIEHYYDKLTTIGMDSFAVTNGKVISCAYTKCSECNFDGGCCGAKRFEWLASPYIKKYKLTQFEYDLLNAYKDSGMRKFVSYYRALLELHEKGYFKGIDMSIPIHDILENCEVSEK